MGDVFPSIKMMSICEGMHNAPDMVAIAINLAVFGSEGAALSWIKSHIELGTAVDTRRAGLTPIGTHDIRHCAATDSPRFLLVQHQRRKEKVWFEYLAHAGFAFDESTLRSEFGQVALDGALRNFQLTGKLGRGHRAAPAAQGLE